MISDIAEGLNGDSEILQISVVTAWISTTMFALTLDNEAYVDFLRYGGMLLVKLMLMSPITTIYRFVYKSFKSEEDGNFLARDNADRRRYLTRTDPNVERVGVPNVHRNVGVP